MEDKTERERPSGASQVGLLLRLAWIRSRTEGPGRLPHSILETTRVKCDTRSRNCQLARGTVESSLEIFSAYTDHTYILQRDKLPLVKWWSRQYLDVKCKVSMIPKIIHHEKFNLYIILSTIYG